MRRAVRVDTRALGGSNSEPPTHVSALEANTPRSPAEAVLQPRAARTRRLNSIACCHAAACTRRERRASLGTKAGRRDLVFTQLCPAAAEQTAARVVHQGAL